MAEITAGKVKELREMTGAGMMDCKMALTECKGDIEKAVDYLRTKGLADLAKKSGRAANEGLVVTHVSADGSVASMVEVNCETDFVARNEEFQGFVAGLAEQVAAAALDDLAALMKQSLASDPSLTVEQALGAVVSKLGENIVIARFARFELGEGGVFGAYVHGLGRIGVVVELGGASGEAGAAKAKDVAMQIAASAPGWISRDQIPADVIEHERQIYADQAAQTGKPEQVVAKIVQGKLEKFFGQVCLLEQAFVKDDSMTVAQYLGDGVEVRRFGRFKLGESQQD
jgi:elongation factor Ts